MIGSALRQRRTSVRSASGRPSVFWRTRPMVIASSCPRVVINPTFAPFFWMMVFAVAATALYGPQAAALVEMFPTRVRYTAMSLPYHVGTGWIGGFLPVTSFALVAITGDVYASLWYPVVFTAVPILVSLLFLKETRGKPLEEV